MREKYTLNGCWQRASFGKGSAPAPMRRGWKLLLLGAPPYPSKEGERSRPDEKGIETECSSLARQVPVRIRSAPAPMRRGLTRYCHIVRPDPVEVGSAPAPMRRGLK